MKKILLFVVVAMLGFVTALACIKKKPSSVNVTQPKDAVTVLVMDTTKALLDGAKVKIGKEVFTTSFDGRVLLKPEQYKGQKSFSVSCEGYHDAKVNIDGRVLIVTLKPKYGHKHFENTRVGAISPSLTKGAVYRTKAVEEKAVAVGAPAPDVLPAPGTEPIMIEPEVFELRDDDRARPHGGSANAVKAGQLTAGEVNDFAKWSLWPSIIDSTHKSFIRDWNICARQRYTVQVVNEKGYPIPNYPVNLTDKKGNTVYQALTDNTGKAELWNGLFGQPAEVDQQAWQTIVVDEPCSQSTDVDVMFVFDATGSMGDELRYLNAEMQDVISRAKEATGGLSIRTGAVVYRDHGDDYITRLSRLTDDLETTKSFIGAQYASGGGDFPEAIPEALMAAVNSAGWNESARARIAFLILDAPCHQDSATLSLLHEQLLNAAAFGIRIVPVVCSGMDKSGELLMRSIALATNGTSFFLTDDSGIGNTHLKPTTDTLKVEHLNDMLVRTIVEFSAMTTCKDDQPDDQIDEQFVPNPFDAKDLANDPTIPHGAGVHYLVDVSGKLITVFKGEVTDYSAEAERYQLPRGLYFVKTYIDGVWYTKKVLVTR